MSRILGRSIDVLQIVTYLQESNIPKYKKDKKDSTWDNIKNVSNEISIYLPNSAIDFLNKGEITIKKSPLRLYTLTSVPDFPDEKRFIKFPSNKPIKEFEREYAFYLGLLLAKCHIDTEEELLELGTEFDDLLPLLLDYLHLKENNKEDQFSIKHLNEIKEFSKYYKKIYDGYNDFYDFTSNAETSSLGDKEYKNFLALCAEKDAEMEKLTLEDIVKLSSLEAALQIIDRNYTKEDFKKLIDVLMSNKDFSRSSVLYENKIDSFGYKRLRKEIDKYKKD